MGQQKGNHVGSTSYHGFNFALSFNKASLNLLKYHLKVLFILVTILKNQTKMHQNFQFVQEVKAFSEKKEVYFYTLTKTSR